jgi:hypothetical protein
MSLEELAIAARNLAHSLGIPVFIRDGRIYQDGPGIEVLPPKGDHTGHGLDDGFRSNTDEAAPE